MGYHILQQFDEQLLADILRRDDFDASESEPNEDATGRQTRSVGLISSFLLQNWMWLILMASLLMAAFALSVAIDARRRADDLQQRYSVLEKSKK
jgi:hypothetical protein